jgi:two-component system, OmpR family, phosphate regulon sensor histidine kinase PhoR
MKRSSINALIILGVLSIIFILLIQVFWINKTLKAQRINVQIQQKEDSLNLTEFSQKVHLALRNTAATIRTNNDDSTDLYQAVKQLSTNHFTVIINEELQPGYLEQLLKHEFYDSGVNEDFLYGIYDCFTDSIKYGNLIKYKKDETFTAITDSTKIPIRVPEWDPDGHYFSVTFPNVSAKSIEVAGDFGSPWLYVFAIFILLILFFGFAVIIIIRQKKLSEIKNDFINNMTHELKTPIATIGLSSETLIRDDFSTDTDRLKRYASIIYKENKRLEHQVERVLNVAKLDKSDIQLSKKELDVHDIIQEASEVFEFNQEEREVQIELQLNATNPKMQADEVHLRNVISNLIDNAIKYCQTTPRVKIVTKNDKNNVIIEIHDNGIGIKREHQTLIFEKFYRVPTGNRHDVKGFGLGLFYVKLMIEQHGGTISVKGNTEKGTTFILSLPIIPLKK